MDVLSDVLLAVRLNGAIFFDVEGRSPFVAESPGTKAVAAQVMTGAEHVISFHIVTEGSCWAELIGHPDPPLRLNAGEIVVFPARGPEHHGPTGMRGQLDLRHTIARPTRPCRFRSR